MEVIEITWVLPGTCRRQGGISHTQELNAHFRLSQVGKGMCMHKHSCSSRYGCVCMLQKWLDMGWGMALTLRKWRHPWGYEKPVKGFQQGMTWSDWADFYLRMAASLATWSHFLTLPLYFNLRQSSNFLIPFLSFTLSAGFKCPPTPGPIGRSPICLPKQFSCCYPHPFAPLCRTQVTKLHLRFGPVLQCLNLQKAESCW